MLDRTDDSSVATDTWLAQFEEALAKADDALLHQLFHPDSYWRDVLALSWKLQTLNGRDAILKALPPLALEMTPSGFAIAPGRAAPRKVMRAGTHAIEAIFKFGIFEALDVVDPGCVLFVPSTAMGAALRRCDCIAHQNVQPALDR